MTRRTWLRIAAAATAVMVALPVIWLLSRPADRVGDVASVEAQLREAISTEPALDQTDVPFEAAEAAPPVSLQAERDDGQVASIENRARPYLLPAQAQPVGLAIPAIGVEAPVEAYGVDRRGQMAVPYNVTDVGWYEHGPSPGESGSAVLAAHVDLAGRGKGVFFDLRRLDPGDVVTVFYDDGSSLDFGVVARVDYQKEELPLDVIFAKDGPAVVTLITCGGAFNSSVGHYDSNVVVYATPLGDRQPAGSAT